jgi:hypothetical protein
VQRACVGAGLPGTYVAWLSTSSTTAVSRVTSNGPYAKRSGEVVATSLADLTDASLASPIDEDENGAAYSGYVWTGTTDAGAYVGVACNGWTNGTNSVFGGVA